MMLKACPYFDLGDESMMQVVTDILREEVSKASIENAVNSEGLKNFYENYLSKTYFLKQSRLYDPKQWSSS